MTILAQIGTIILELLTSLFTKKSIDKITETFHTKKGQLDWKEAEKAYRKSLIKNYSWVNVIGEPQRMPLENIFTDVYLLDEPTAQSRFNIQQLKDIGVKYFRTPIHNSLERHNGMGLVTQKNNLYILGKPGAGKTTFLKHIATQGADYRFLDKLPIFVSLHEWAVSDYNDLISFIVKQFDIYDFPNAYEFIVHRLQQGQGLLLFDGLDEVPREGKRRQEVILLLHDFIRKYDGCQYLITCRVAASEYDFSSFSYVEVADFTQEQIKSYAEKRFEDNSKYEAFVKALQEAQNQGIQELCNVPLLLSLICLYFDRTMLLPRRRSELYMKALDILLTDWDAKRSIQRDIIFYRELTPQRKQQMLAHIATPAFEEGKYFFESHALGKQIADYLSKLPGSPAADDIDGEEVLKEIAAQHGLLVERAANIYSFSHLTFQEYFTARYIADNEARGTTQSLIRNHLTDQRWREVFLLVASLIDKGDDFYRSMRMEVDTFLTQRERLEEIAIWSQSRTQAAHPTEDRQASVRLAYMSLALARARALALDLDLALALDRDRALALALARARSRSREKFKCSGWFRLWTLLCVDSCGHFYSSR